MTLLDVDSSHNKADTENSRRPQLSRISLLSQRCERPTLCGLGKHFIVTSAPFPDIVLALFVLMCCKAHLNNTKAIPISFSVIS